MMKGSQTTFPFLKTADCPTSQTLLSYRSNNVSIKAAARIKEHLGACDFCNAELPLLAHHQPQAGRLKAPEIPMNLRILAESILGRG